MRTHISECRLCCYGGCGVLRSAALAGLFSRAKNARPCGLGLSAIERKKKKERCSCSKLITAFLYTTRSTAYKIAATTGTEKYNIFTKIHEIWGTRNYTISASLELIFLGIYIHFTQVRVFSEHILQKCCRKSPNVQKTFINVSNNLKYGFETSQNA